MVDRFTAGTVACLLSLTFACTRSVPEEDQTQADLIPVVCVSNYPLQYFVERIASPLVDVQFPASGSGDPAYWQPSADEISALQQADLILLNGASYEKWLANVTLPQAKLVDTSEGFKDRLIASEETVTHSHGPEGEHEHRGTAFTTWLDPQLAVEQARSVHAALKTILPGQKETLEERFSKLEDELVELDALIERIISSAPETEVIFSHPVYQYFERRYGIQGISVHWEPDVSPDPAVWKEFVSLLEHHRVEWMIWEGQPLPEVVEELERLGIGSIMFDPCGNLPDSGDFMRVMRENVSSLEQVFGG